MRKALLLLATMLPLLVAAQGWPASYGGVVLVVDNDTQKNDVINNAATYTKWFDLIFLGNGQTVTSENINTFAAAKTGFIAYFQDLNQATAKSYLDAGYWGYRYRTSGASKANAEATRDINAALNATFVVGDMYGNSTDTNVLKQWLKFNYKDGNYQSAICDNSLSVQMRNNNENGEAWNDQGLHSDYIAKHYCLNYVDGATTDIAKKRSMYAFILTRPGTPIVFYGDWNNNGDFLESMIAVRHAVGINNQAAIQGSTEHASGKYYYTVYGTKGSVLVRLGKDYVNQSTPSGYTEVWKDRIDGNNPRFSVYISDNVVDDYNAMLTNSANVRGGDSEPIGFPIIDKASGHYTNSVSVNIKPNNNRTTLVFTTDGTMPTYLSEKVTDAVNGRTLNLTETTTLKVGVVETDGKTVNVSNTVVRQYVVDGIYNSSITIYAKRGDQSSTAPVIYATVGGNAVANNVTMSSTKVVGGVEWYYYTFTSASSVRFILKESQNGKETPWLTADRDAFYTFCDHPQSGQGGLKSYASGVACYAFNETNTYMVDYYDPKVSIDKASGDYKNWVQPTVSATYKDAIIVYTTDDSEPTPTNGTQVTGPYKIEDNVFKYDGVDKSVTLRAGVLYNGKVINLVARTYHIKANEAQSYGSTIGIGTNGINIFVRSSSNNPWNIVPGIYYWNGSTSSGPTALSTTKTVGGVQWYYMNIPLSSCSIIITSGSSYNYQTSNITGLTTGSYFFDWQPGNSEGKDKPYQNVTTTYKPKLDEVITDNNYVDQGNLIPSCATYVPSKQFFYFENNKPYVSPYSWIISGNTPISADCWPGSAFIEPIGTSPEGYAIYRWVYDEKTLNAKMIFNDNGGNVVGSSQTGEYNFENSGYYNVSGLQGKVSASYVTLAEAIRYATETQQYYITDDLYVGHISQDGQYIYAKDARGSALNPFYPRADFTLNWDKDDNAYAYDQSNWVEIKLPAEKWIPKTDRNSYIGKTIAGGTLYGTFRSRENPQIEIATGGMLPVFNPGGYNVTLAAFNREKAYEAFNYNSFRDDSNGVGDLNLYHTGNFLTSVGDIDNTEDRPIINGDRFYVNPKILEVAAIRWAVYKEDQDGGKGKFYAPSNSNSAKGCIEIVNDPSSNSDSWWEGGITLQDGKVYLLKGIVINKGSKYLFHKDDDDYHHNAPRRVSIVPATPGDRYSIRLIDAYTDDRITGVNDVNINKTIESVRYINLMGAESSRAFDGVNIVVTKYSDGTTSTTKVVF